MTRAGSVFRLSLAMVFTASVLCFSQEPGAAKQAELEQGKKLFNQCRACHPLDASGRAETGPNLYGVVGRKVGQQPDFAYSEALLDKKIVWTEGELDKFLKSPREYAPGTTMAFSGLKERADRKAVIEYLKSAKAGEKK